MKDPSKERQQLAIVDYGLGNQFSLQSSFRQLGHRSLITNDQALLDQANILVLPGVGAFPKAMENLSNLKLDVYLKQASKQGRGIIGICLGMQMLTERSSELGTTLGLGLIPGETTALKQCKWHIGWNDIEPYSGNDLLATCSGDVMYFNHAFCYKGPDEYIAGVSRIHPDSNPIVAAIQKDNLIGLQFHPEKSQQSGLRLLEIAIRSIC